MRRGMRKSNWFCRIKLVSMKLSRSCSCTTENTQINSYDVMLSNLTLWPCIECDLWIRMNTYLSSLTFRISPWGGEKYLDLCYLWTLQSGLKSHTISCIHHFIHIVNYSVVPLVCAKRFYIQFPQRAIKY